MNIKRWIAVAIVLTVGVLAPTQSVSAQTRVAIVDVGLVFKSHPQFTQQLAVLKKQADDFKSVSIQAQQTLVQKAEVLKQYKPGSPDYKSAESKLAQESAAMEVEQRNKMRNLMETEAKLHYETYQEINAVIAKLCDAQGIQLVLRHNGQRMDPNQPATVMQRVNSSIVFHSPQNDITEAIVTQLGGKIGTANAAAPTRR